MEEKDQNATNPLISLKHGGTPSQDKGGGGKGNPLGGKPNK